MSAMSEIVDELVVFRHETGEYFSNSPMWNDSRVRAAWVKKYGEQDEPEVEEDDEEEGEDYSAMTAETLRGELISRGLSVEGKKADLIARLEKADQEAE